MKNRTVSDIFPVGQKVYFRSGNYIGRYAEVEKVDNESNHPKAIYGFLITVRFEDNKIGFVEKTEHIQKI